MYFDVHSIKNMRGSIMNNAVILAAGKSSRMGMGINKVLLNCAGVPILKYHLDALRASKINKIIIVLGYQGDQVKKLLNKDINIVYQNKCCGTGDAVMTAIPQLSGDDYTIIINGDGPFLSAEQLNKLLEEAQKYDFLLLTQVIKSSNKFGRILRDKNNKILKIIEASDATKNQLKIEECNSGVYVIKTKILCEYIKKIKAENNQCEYYFTDILELLVNDNKNIGSFSFDEGDFLNSVNTLTEFSEMESVVRYKINSNLLSHNIWIHDVRNTYIDKQCRLEPMCEIYANAHILGESVIGERTKILPNCYIKNCKIGRDCLIDVNCVLEGINLEDNTILSPNTKMICVK